MRKKMYLLLRQFAAGLLAAAMILPGAALPVSAEESYEEAGEDQDDEEEEYIPETYYEPIQTNDLTNWPQGQAVQAAAAIVMDLDTGTILYGKNIEDKHYPASITKIMTTLVALDYGDLDTVFTVGEEVYDIEEDSSNLGIQPGEELTMRQALYGLMLESANDLGNAIAVHVAGSNSAFAELMNQKAAQLGCTNTHFTNPHGLHDEEHYTCARDMALISQAAYENETFRQIAATRESMIPATNLVEEDRYFANHQKLLQPESDYYQPWCTGGKTGFTSAAWNTLVTFAEQGEMKLVCVLLRENGAGTSYLETTDLIQYGFSNFERVPVDKSYEIPTFYDLLDLKYPNADTTRYTIAGLKQKVYSILDPGEVMVPKGTDLSVLKREAGGAADGSFRYLYDGWPVGKGQWYFTPFPTDFSFEYRQPRNMEELLEKSKSERTTRELKKTADTAVQDLTSTITDLKETAGTFIRDNTLTVLLAGAFLLAVLLILIIILIMRVTKEYRLQRRRYQEDMARRRMEDEIDQKSAVEIEKELRLAMEEENQLQKIEEQRQEQERLAEAKLQEAEQILEEIKRQHDK